METLKKIYCILCIIVAVFATIGGTAYLFYYHQPHFAIANLGLAAMAVPFVIERVKELLGSSNSDKK